MSLAARAVEGEMTVRRGMAAVLALAVGAALAAAAPARAGIKDWWDSLVGGKKEGETKPVSATAPKVQVPPPDQEVYRINMRVELGSPPDVDAIASMRICDLRFGTTGCLLTFDWPKEKAWRYVNSVQLTIRVADNVRDLFHLSANASGWIAQTRIPDGTTLGKLVGKFHRPADVTSTLAGLADGVMLPLKVAVRHDAELVGMETIGRVTVTMAPASAALGQ